MYDVKEAPLEEIRRLCSLVIDRWQAASEEDGQDLDGAEIRSAEVALTMLLGHPVRRTVKTEPPPRWVQRLRAVADACVEPLGYMIKLAGNLLAMVLLHVDHRYLNFRYERRSQQHRRLVECLGAPWLDVGDYRRYAGVLKPDSPYIHMLTILRDQPEMLERTRQRMMTDEQAARMLAGWLQEVAYEEAPLWTGLYFRLSELGIPAAWTDNARERMLTVFRADNPLQENAIKAAMNEHFGDKRAKPEEVVSVKGRDTQTLRGGMDGLPQERKGQGGLAAFLERLITPPEIPGNGPTSSGDRNGDQEW